MSKRACQFALSALLLGTCVTVNATPTCLLGPGNVGIGNPSYRPFGCALSVTQANTFNISEAFTSADIGVIAFSGLAANTVYTVNILLMNASGSDFTRMALELLDPVRPDQIGNDGSDVLPYPAFVPLGWSTSNDDDGISFAQGFGIPRTSSVFDSVMADELTDSRDFLDFYDGTLRDGQSDLYMSFGLHNNGSDGQFLLVQRPNAVSRPIAQAAPEPGTVMLMLTAMAALVGRRRRFD